MLCNALTEPDNGGVDFTNRLRVGSNAQFTCKDGFVIKGKNPLTCILDKSGRRAKWNGKPPKCKSKWKMCEYIHHCHPSAGNPFGTVPSVFHL